jgi:uncharacterized OsmC-like protein
MHESAQYMVTAQSSGTFGRVLCSSRNHHFVIDGPVANGCPGEAVTPVEQFLSSVAACGVELIEVIARQENIEVDDARVEISTTSGRQKDAGRGVTTLESVSISVSLTGPSQQEAELLVERFKGR